MFRYTISKAAKLEIDEKTRGNFRIHSSSKPIDSYQSKLAPEAGSSQCGEPKKDVLWNVVSGNVASFAPSEVCRCLGCMSSGECNGIDKTGSRSWCN